MQMIADGCGLCASSTPPVRTQKFRDHPGGFAVCPRCDRLPCRKCRNPVMDGKAKTCPHCQHPVGSPAPPAPKEST